MPDNPTDMCRIFRLLDRVARTEITAALGKAQLAHVEDDVSIDIACDAQSRLIHGRFSYTDHTGQRQEHQLVRLRVSTDAAIWVCDAAPPLVVRPLARIDIALRRWLNTVLGQELDDRLSACFAYAQALVPLANYLDPNFPVELKVLDLDRLRGEARHRGAELAAILFTDRNSPEREVATLMATIWHGAFADLLAATKNVMS